MRRSLWVMSLIAVLALEAWIPGVYAADGEVSSHPGRGAYRTRHVIVAVMDGVRFSETFGDPEHRYVPRMWAELVPQGTLYTNFYNRGVTVTRQGHSTIASGTWQVVPNGGPRLTRPTFFDYFREETGAPAEKTWAIFGKAAYSFAPYSSFPTYLDRWAPKAIIGVGEKSPDDDRRVLETARAVMKEHRPDLMFLNFGYTDHSGHVGSFEEYTRAVTNVDALFAELWATIQADPEYRDSTTLILTNDHGRHDDAHGGFHHHGDGDEGCRHIFLLLVGPDTKRGAVIDQAAEQIDLAPTVGELLGFQTPLAEGRVLQESFVDFLGLNRKEARTAVEKEAVRTLELAGRDLGRAVSRRALADLNLTGLPATPETAMLFRGLLNHFKVSPSPDRVLALQEARDWLERTRGATGAAQLYRASVLFDLAQYSRGSLRDHLTSEEALTPGWSDVDRAFLVNLLARAKAVDRISQVVNALAGPEGRLSSPPAAQTNPHEQALVLYALSDALLALDELKQERSNLQATVARLRDLCLLRYYGAVQNRVEPGGLWPDPTDSLLYLAAARRLEAAGAFRDFRSRKKLARDKEQNERPFLPPAVANLPAEAIAAWTAPQAKTGAGAGQLRRRMAAAIWEANRYLDFSQESTRSLVDEHGAVRGGDPALAAGAFLQL